MSSPNERSAHYFLKRWHHEHLKSLIAKVEVLLPREFTSVPKRNGAGKRSVGSSGRSVNDVLSDLLRCIRYLRGMGTSSRPCTRAVTVKKEACPGVDTVNLFSIGTEALMMSHNMLVVEVKVGAQDNWIIARGGECAEKMWGSVAPWQGSCVGHSMSQLVHHNDFPAVHRRVDYAKKIRRRSSSGCTTCLLARAC